MEVWVTKYALTDGISKMREPELVQDKYYRDRAVRHITLMGIGKDAFTSESEAKADAEKRRKAKIASLKRQIAKLEAMKF